MMNARDAKLGSASEFELRDNDRTANYMYDDRKDGRSNFVAFLLGGVVIAGGLLSFLYYDSNSLQGMDQMTSGSVSQSSGAIMPVPSIRILPDRPENK